MAIVLLIIILAILILAVVFAIQNVAAVPIETDAMIGRDNYERDIKQVMGGKPIHDLPKQRVGESDLKEVGLVCEIGSCFIRPDVLSLGHSELNRHETEFIGMLLALFIV